MPPVDTEIQESRAPEPTVRRLQRRPARRRAQRARVAASAPLRSANLWLPEPPGPEQARLRDRRVRRVLALADVVAAAVALLVCVPLLGRGDNVSLAAVALLPAIVLSSKVLGLYDRDELLLRRSTLDEAPSLFQLATLSALLLWLGNSVFVAGELGRDQVLGFWVLFSASLLLARAFARSAASRSSAPERCLVLADDETAASARSKIDSSHTVDARVVGHSVLEHPDGSLLEADDLAQIAAEVDAHRVLIAPSSSDQGEVLDLIRASKALGLKVSVLPRMLEVVGSSVEFDDIDGVGILGVRHFGLTRSSFVIKRAFDICGAALGLVLAAPLLGPLALAIWLDSRGPVFFRQQRVGRDGVSFEMLKFRTMVVDAESRKQALSEHNEADGLFKIADDPRITKVGRLLRSSSLDELPQLLNVLRGEMSLVGPRPLVAEDDRRVRGWYRRRLHLTPGMTGRWQVLGSARIPLHEMVKLDYLYVANWSLWGDVKIMLRTLPYMLRRRGM